jgi:hypothetical protein
MQAGGSEHEKQRAQRPTAASVLSHPLRVRILEVLNERDMSPAGFFKSGLVLGKPSMPVVAYHFRTLHEDGSLEIVAEEQVRGAVEHTYRGIARTYYTDEEWARFTGPKRRNLSKAVWQGMAARVDGAMLERTFDSRPDRHLTWSALDLDEQGWDEITAELAESFHRIRRIRHAAARRLRESSQIPIHTTVGLLGFESPRTVDAADAVTEPQAISQ